MEASSLGVDPASPSTPRANSRSMEASSSEIPLESAGGSSTPPSSSISETSAASVVISSPLVSSASSMANAAPFHPMPAMNAASIVMKPFGRRGVPAASKSSAASSGGDSSRSQPTTRKTLACVAHRTASAAPRGCAAILSNGGARPISSQHRIHSREVPTLVSLKAGVGTKPGWPSCS